jgi:uncharacterized protein (DUF362 family)
MSIDKSVIYFTKNLERKKFVSSLMAHYKGNIKGKVLLKVNLVSHDPYPTTTHPEMIEAVYNQIKSKASEIICGDGQAVDVSSSKIENHPIIEKCNELGISFVNFHKHRFKKVRTSRNFPLKVSEIPFQQDYVISLPILKDHFILGLTNALKDKFGYFAKGERIKMHSKIKNINKGIAELNTVIKSNLIICDAVKVLVKAQELRHGGIEKDLGYIFAGTDPVALDFYGYKLLRPISMKLNKIETPQQIKYIKHSLDYEIGVSDYELKEI